MAYPMALYIMLILLIQLEYFHDLFIIEGTDGYRCQTKGGNLKIDVLRGMLLTNTLIFASSSAISIFSPST